MRDAASKGENVANRFTLHFKHLDEFKAWLDERGVEHRPGVPPYQVLRVRARSGWAAVYVRDSATQHFSVPENLTGMVGDFFRSRKREA